MATEDMEVTIIMEPVKMLMLDLLKPERLQRQIRMQIRMQKRFLEAIKLQ